MMSRICLLCVGFHFTFAALSSATAASYVPGNASPPPVSREFRAAWVASVANIDWPSTNGLSTARQKAELVAMLDAAAKLKLNAIIFQVRPACDALYTSSLEPWSEYLTGTSGKAPEPYYDPLAFAVEQAHKRGLQLHAWFNPYRARHQSAKSPAPRNHISRTRPDLVKQYGNQLWLDPGEKDVQDYSLRVVMDVVKRYDIDGVHFDDYFYPYKEKNGTGGELDFPDDASWKRFGAGGKLSRDDWRRENVNVFVQRVYKSIKATKPWVTFGISPFGIWRPGNPPQIQGYDAYEKLYADSRKWLANGWLDYFAPQLYWSTDAAGQSFPVLLRWWRQQNSQGRHIWAGLNSNNGKRWGTDEIVRQINFTRKYGNGSSSSSGHIHWSMRKALMENDGLERALQREIYSTSALVPSCPWLQGPTTAPKPKITARLWRDGARATWSSETGTNAKVVRWIVQTRIGSNWTTEIVGATQHSSLWKTRPEVITVAAVDRYGTLSAPAAVELRK